MTNDRWSFRESRAARTGGSSLLNAMVIAWQITRLLMVAILMSVEPIVGFVLCGLALVGVIVSVILKFSGAAPHFPFWPALAMSVGLYLAFVIYVAVVRSLVPQPRED
jgi:putative flippase GtrA